MRTDLDLATELQEVSASPPKDMTAGQRSLLRRIIEQAKVGYYHDFRTGLATPKAQLAHDLQAVGLLDIRARVINGDYDDESPEDTQPE